MRPSCKLIAIALLAGVAVADAHAVTCAQGVYRAGCAGPNGAAVVRKPAPAAVVVAPKPVVVAPANCAWVNGRKVCR